MSIRISKLVWLWLLGTLDASKRGKTGLDISLCLGCLSVTLSLFLSVFCSVCLSDCLSVSNINYFTYIRLEGPSDTSVDWELAENEFKLKFLKRPSSKAFLLGASAKAQETLLYSAVRVPLGVDQPLFHRWIQDSGLCRSGVNLCVDRSISAFVATLVRTVDENMSATIQDVRNWMRLGNAEIKVCGPGVRKLLWRVLFGDKIPLEDGHTNDTDPGSYQRTLRVFAEATVDGYATTGLQFYTYLTNNWCLGHVLQYHVDELNLPSVEAIHVNRRLQYAFCFVLEQDHLIADAMLNGFLSRCSLTSRQARTCAEADASDSDDVTILPADDAAANNSNNLLNSSRANQGWTWLLPASLQKRTRHLIRCLQQAIVLRAMEPQAESKSLEDIEGMQRSPFFRQVLCWNATLGYRQVAVSTGQSYAHAVFDPEGEFEGVGLSLLNRTLRPSDMSCACMSAVAACKLSLLNAVQPWVAGFIAPDEAEIRVKEMLDGTSVADLKLYQVGEASVLYPSGWHDLVFQYVPTLSATLIDDDHTIFGKLITCMHLLNGSPPRYLHTFFS